jgi:hypothetical protein
VTYLLVLSIPFVFFLSFVAAHIWLDQRRPTPQALGAIFRKLCIVDYDEISRYNEHAQAEEKASHHLHREIRWKQICVNWAFLRLMISNTKLFQQATRFEKIKIDPAKSALDYNSREHLVLELVDDSTDMRRGLHKARLNLLMRALFGLPLDYQIIRGVLVQYKRLEEDMVAFAGMSDNDSYQFLLVDRLGIRRSWGVIDGGADTPA